MLAAFTGAVDPDVWSRAVVNDRPPLNNVRLGVHHESLTYNNDNDDIRRHHMAGGGVMAAGEEVPAVNGATDSRYAVRTPDGMRYSRFVPVGLSASKTAVEMESSVYPSNVKYVKNSQSPTRNGRNGIADTGDSKIRITSLPNTFASNSVVPRHFTAQSTFGASPTHQQATASVTSWRLDTDSNPNSHFEPHYHPRFGTSITNSGMGMSVPVVKQVDEHSASANPFVRVGTMSFTGDGARTRQYSPLMKVNGDRTTLSTSSTATTTTTGGGHQLRYTDSTTGGNVKSYWGSTSPTAPAATVVPIGANSMASRFAKLGGTSGTTGIDGSNVVVHKHSRGGVAASKNNMVTSQRIQQQLHPHPNSTTTTYRHSDMGGEEDYNIHNIRLVDHESPSYAHKTYNNTDSTALPHHRGGAIGGQQEYTNTRQKSCGSRLEIKTGGNNKDSVVFMDFTGTVPKATTHIEMNRGSPAVSVRATVTAPAASHAGFCRPQQMIVPSPTPPTFLSPIVKPTVRSSGEDRVYSGNDCTTATTGGRILLAPGAGDMSSMVLSGVASSIASSVDRSPVAHPIRGGRLHEQNHRPGARVGSLPGELLPDFYNNVRSPAILAEAVRDALNCAGDVGSNPTVPTAAAMYANAGDCPSSSSRSTDIIESGSPHREVLQQQKIRYFKPNSTGQFVNHTRGSGNTRTTVVRKTLPVGKFNGSCGLVSTSKHFVDTTTYPPLGTPSRGASAHTGLQHRNVSTTAKDTNMLYQREWYLQENDLQSATCTTQPLHLRTTDAVPRLATIAGTSPPASPRSALRSPGGNNKRFRHGVSFSPVNSPRNNPKDSARVSESNAGTNTTTTAGTTAAGHTAFTVGPDEVHQTTYAPVADLPGYSYGAGTIPGPHTSGRPTTYPYTTTSGGGIRSVAGDVPPRSISPSKNSSTRRTSGGVSQNIKANESSHPSNRSRKHSTASILSGAATAGTTTDEHVKRMTSRKKSTASHSQQKYACSERYPSTSTGKAPSVPKLRFSTMVENQYKDNYRGDPSKSSAWSACCQSATKHVVSPPTTGAPAALLDLPEFGTRNKRRFTQKKGGDENLAKMLLKEQARVKRVRERLTESKMKEKAEQFEKVPGGYRVHDILAMAERTGAVDKSQQRSKKEKKSNKQQRTRKSSNISSDDGTNSGDNSESSDENNKNKPTSIFDQDPGIQQPMCDDGVRKNSVATKDAASRRKSTKPTSTSHMASATTGTHKRNTTAANDNSTKKGGDKHSRQRSRRRSRSQNRHSKSQSAAKRKRSPKPELQQEPKKRERQSSVLTNSNMVEGFINGIQVQQQPPALTTGRMNDRARDAASPVTTFWTPSSSPTTATRQSSTRGGGEHAGVIAHTMQSNPESLRGRALSALKSADKKLNDLRTELAANVMHGGVAGFDGAAVKGRRLESMPSTATFYRSGNSSRNDSKQRRTAK